MMVRLISIFVLSFLVGAALTLLAWDVLSIRIFGYARCADCHRRTNQYVTSFGFQNQHGEHESVSFAPRCADCINAFLDQHYDEWHCR